MNKPKYDDPLQYCSHACIFYWPDGTHDPDCFPIDPPTEAEQEATREAYKREKVRAHLRQSKAAYDSKNHLPRTPRREKE